MIDNSETREEDEVEFAKSILAPQTTVQGFLDMMDHLMEAYPPPEPTK